MATILMVIIFIACVPEGDSFTAGAGIPKRQGKRAQVRIVLSSIRGMICKILPVDNLATNSNQQCKT